MQISPEPQIRDVRTLFVSDIHLGCRFAQPENFLSYLEKIRPEKLYILGDFLDGWKLKAAWRWNPIYTQIVSRILYLSNTGTQLYYTPGNHDAFLRCSEVQQIVRSTGIQIQVQDEFVHVTSHGQRLLLTHGDKFDVVEMRAQWLSMATSYVYEPLLSFNWIMSRFSGQRQFSPYKMCAVVKDKVKGAVKFLSNFERRLFDHARERRCDGIVCGHIHKPGVARIDSMTYLNTGDWVENCTAIVENHDGSMYLESFFPGVPTRQITPPIQEEVGGTLDLPVETPIPVAAMAEAVTEVA